MQSYFSGTFSHCGSHSSYREGRHLARIRRLRQYVQEGVSFDCVKTVGAATQCPSPRGLSSSLRNFHWANT